MRCTAAEPHLAAPVAPVGRAPDRGWVPGDGDDLAGGELHGVVPIDPGRVDAVEAHPGTAVPRAPARRGSVTDVQTTVPAERDEPVLGRPHALDALASAEDR